MLVHPPPNKRSPLPGFEEHVAGSRQRARKGRTEGRWKQDINRTKGSRHDNPTPERPRRTERTLRQGHRPGFAPHESDPPKLLDLEKLLRDAAPHRNCIRAPDIMRCTPPHKLVEAVQLTILHNKIPYENQYRKPNSA